MAVADIGMGQSLGERGRQEDRMDRYPAGPGPASLLVLSDGMGGAVGGDVAAEFIVDVTIQTWAETLKPDGATMRTAAQRANEAIRAHVIEHPDMEGMGGTLLCVRLDDDGIMFFSMGDSPLFHVRGEHIRRLNADHSLGGLLDAAAARGEITVEEARSRRDRNSILSFLGGKPLEEMRMDETIDVAPMQPGDVLILASDGLETLPSVQIAELVNQGGGAVAMVDRLLAAVKAAGHPRQDNTSVIVVEW